MDFYTICSNLRKYPLAEYAKLPLELQLNQEIVKILCEYSYSYVDVPEEVYQIDKLLSILIQYKKVAFKNIPLEKLSNKKIVEKLMLTMGEYFQYLDNEFRDDPDVVKNAIIKNADVFEYISVRLRTDGDFIKELFNLQPKIAKFLPHDLLRQPFFYEKAYAHWFENKITQKDYDNVPKFYLEDREVMEFAIGRNVKWLKYSPLINDLKMIERAIYFSPRGTFKILPKNVMESVEVLKLFVESGNYNIFDELDPTIFDDEELVDILFDLNSVTIRFASERIRDNSEYMYKKCLVDTYVWGKCSDRLKREKRFLRIAICEDLQLYHLVEDFELVYLLRTKSKCEFSMLKEVCPEICEEIIYFCNVYKIGIFDAIDFMHLQLQIPKKMRYEDIQFIFL